MINAYRILGLDEHLAITDEALKDAFRIAGKQAHPDGGGNEEIFAGLREAMDTLSSPARRLRHWLELRGSTPEPRGTVDAGLMDLFASVGEVTQQAEALIRKRGETQSALALAMLEKETQHCREQVERAVRIVEDAIADECARFPEYEENEDPNHEAAFRTLRNLGFLERWKASLRSVFSRLV
jgi:curved DNA-binding protein CbpA